jgi:cyclic pyranopterin monophosphate synthase
VSEAGEASGERPLSPSGGPADDADGLTHLDATGAARMVDVSHKPDSVRVARAAGAIRMQQATLDAVVAGRTPKGDVLAVARVAGIMGAKRTPELIPLCHPVALSGVEVAIAVDASLPGLRVEATARCTGPTGVEMEALTAVSVCLLTLYDMVKSLDGTMEIGYLSLLSKSGGTKKARQQT